MPRQGGNRELKMKKLKIGGLEEQGLTRFGGALKQSGRVKPMALWKR
jgi:hypothetical protein